MNKTISLLLLALCLCCMPAHSRADNSPAPAALLVHSVDCTGWPIVTITANLPLTDSAGKDISLTIPGSPAPLTPDHVNALHDKNEAENLLVAIDTSKSLGDDFLEAIKTALKDYIRHLGKGEHVALLAFNDAVQIASGFTDSQTRIETALGTLRQGGIKTALYQAILEGISLLTPLSGKKAMLVISDGHNEGPGELQEVIQAAKDAHIRICSIALPEKHSEQKRHQEQLQTLASETDGVFQTVDSPLSAASGIFTLLQAQRQKGAARCDYRLTFTIPADIAGTQQALKAVLSQKTGDSALSVDITLNVPVSEHAPAVLNDQAQHVLEFIKSPAGLGCVAGAVLVLTLLVVLFLRKRRSALKTPEDPGMALREEAKQSPFVLELVSQSMTFPLPCGKIRLGAAKDNDIVLDDPTVSRKHACLEVTEQECRVTDTQSTNGTFVNGERISRSCILTSGDQIYFGKTQACLRIVMQGGYNG